MNHSVSRFHRAMRHLALIAMALMLCMPVINRWQHTHMQDGQGNAEMCISDVSRAALEMDAPGADVSMHGHPAGRGSPLHDQHMDHGVECGYCTFATRVLPVFALVLALPLLPAVRHSSVPALPAVPVAPLWPAYSPRGPPLIS